MSAFMGLSINNTSRMSKLKMLAVFHIRVPISVKTEYEVC